MDGQVSLAAHAWRDGDCTPTDVTPLWLRPGDEPFYRDSNRARLGVEGPFGEAAPGRAQEPPRSVRDGEGTLEDGSARRRLGQEQVGQVHGERIAVGGRPQADHVVEQ